MASARGPIRRKSRLRARRISRGAGSDVTACVSPLLHRDLDDPGGVLRRVGGEPVPRGARPRLRRRRGGVARRRGGAGRLRREVPAEDQTPVIRRILFTALLVAAPRAAFACPVCFGENDSPLATA